MRRSIRVFILEDDIPTRDGLILRLTADSNLLVCEVAGSLAEARSSFANSEPDILLVDLQLPDGNAVDLITEWTQRSPDTPILVISVFGDEGQVIGAIEAGARGYLLKDDSGEELVDSIHRVLAGQSPISPAIARHLIRRFQPPRHDSPDDTKSTDLLSARELEVLRLASKGFTYQETATVLGLTVNTIGTYTRRVYTKLAVNSRAQAIFEARQLGLMGEHE